MENGSERRAAAGHRYDSTLKAREDTLPGRSGPGFPRRLVHAFDARVRKPPRPRPPGRPGGARGTGPRLTGV